LAQKRHLGKLVNTDIRCVVVFMQIPDRQDHALVVSTDNLNPRFEQALMSIVESQEGQSEPTLAKVLNRRLLPDTGQNFLQALHEAQLLRAVHIDQVIMLPMPHMQFPLRQVIEMMGGAAPAMSEEHPVIDPDKFNPHVQNANAMSQEQRIGVARNLIVEAEMLENDARTKRERAYILYPELQKKTPAPKVQKTALIETNTVPVQAKKTPAKRAAKTKPVA
jgi:hypothetical protein